MSHIITFSGASSCSQAPLDAAWCYVRVLVDDIPAAPGDVEFDSVHDGNSGLALEANSMQFVAGPLSAGRHVVKMQFRLDEPNGQFQLEGCTLTVLSARV